MIKIASVIFTRVSQIKFFSHSAPSEMRLKLLNEFLSEIINFMTVDHLSTAQNEVFFNRTVCPYALVSLSSLIHARTVLPIKLLKIKGVIFEWICC